MNPAQTVDLKQALLSRGIDFRVVDSLVIRIDGIFQKEHGALMTAARTLYDVTDDVSDDPVVESAREGLEPFLNL